MTQTIETKRKKRDTTKRLAASQWLEIQALYIAGIETLKDIGQKYGVSAASIAQMASRKGWERDAHGKAKLLAQEKINDELGKNALTPTIVEAIADKIVLIDEKHKAEVSRARSIAQSLLDELEAISGMEGDANLQELGEIVLSGCPMRLKHAYNKVIGLNNKVGLIKTLTDTLKTLVQLEREIYNMTNSDGDKVEDALANVLNSIATRNNSALIPLPLDVDYVERTELKDIN